MNDIKINTDQVTILANNIKKQNEKMREEFDMAVQAVKRLNDAWDGPAATNAIGKFNQMKTQICEQRYKELDNYVSFLFQQVGVGYDNTESVNKSLADQFK